MSCAAFCGALDDDPTLADVAQLELSILPTIDKATMLEAGANAEPAPAASREWLGQLRHACVVAAERAAHRLAELKQLAARCAELADLDYEFLYDRDRHLLAIGYNLAEHRLDASFYDLLASEGTTGQLRCHLAGKAPAGALVRTGSPADHGRRSPGAALLERLDVRVPDAAPW
jgi:hypothetical protein